MSEDSDRLQGWYDDIERVAREMGRHLDDFRYGAAPSVSGGKLGGSSGSACWDSGGSGPGGASNPRTPEPLPECGDTYTDRNGEHHTSVCTLPKGHQPAYEHEQRCKGGEIVATWTGPSWAEASDVEAYARENDEQQRTGQPVPTWEETMKAGLALDGVPLEQVISEWRASKTRIAIGDLVRIHNGGGRGRVVSGPCFVVQSDQGGIPQTEDVANLSPLGGPRPTKPLATGTSDGNIHMTAKVCDECGHFHSMCVAQAKRDRSDYPRIDAWKDQDDKPLPEDEEIRAAFPTYSGRHDTYAQAMRLVGARHSKGGLVALVNWLLVRRIQMTIGDPCSETAVPKLVFVHPTEAEALRAVVKAARSVRSAWSDDTRESMNVEMAALIDALEALPAVPTGSTE